MSDGPNPPRGFTLLELLIVIALVLVLASFVVPIFTGEMERRRLTDSISQMQSLIQIVRAHAMNDGRRYRIRWPDEANYKEAEEKGETLQPIVEVEGDAIGQPGVFTEVNDVWAQGDTIYPGIQCVKVVLGEQQPNEPNELVEVNQNDQMNQVADGVENMFDEKDQLDDMLGSDPNGGAMGGEEQDPNRPAVVFEADGTAEWARIYLTNGKLNDDGEFCTWEIVIDGRTGNVGWRQTPTQAETEQFTADVEANREEHKIVRGREIGAK